MMRIFTVFIVLIFSCFSGINSFATETNNEKPEPLLFGRYFKISGGIGGKHIIDNPGEIRSTGLVYNFGLEHFLDSSETFSIKANYFYLNVEDENTGVQALNQFGTLIFKYYFLKLGDDFSINIHAGGINGSLLFTWDVGGSIEYNFISQLSLQSTVNVLGTIPSFLPGYRWPLIYKINLNFKF